MKKILTVLLISVFAMGCSKDSDTKPDDTLIGTWKATKLEILYQKTDGNPYRDGTITGDISNDDPKFTLIMKEKSLIILDDDGKEEELNYSRNANEIELIADGRKRKINYSISGNTLTLRNTEKNENVYGDVKVDKQITIIRLEKVNPKLNSKI